MSQFSGKSCIIAGHKVLSGLIRINSEMGLDITATSDTLIACFVNHNHGKPVHLPAAGRSTDNMMPCLRPTRFEGVDRAKSEWRLIMENQSACAWLHADRWLSVDEIAAYLGIKRDTVYKWIAEKKMPAHKMGRLWKFRKEEVDEWVKSGGADARHNI